jgi:hypothetical protein
MRRTSKYKNQSCFRCYSGPNFGGDDRAPCTDTKLDSEGFPKVPCLGGIRSNIVYPTCWDGKNLDSPNHQDHIAYPKNGPAAFLSTGDCPSTHPVKIPQLMLEVVWDTTSFNNKAEWPEDGSQPFYLSTGDNTGFGQHGVCLSLSLLLAFPTCLRPDGWLINDLSLIYAVGLRFRLER